MLYLPPYSPDLNPIEKAWAKIKQYLRSTRARSKEDIIKEVKRHSYYMKPGEKMRMKQALARKRNRKKARKEQTD